VKLRLPPGLPGTIGPWVTAAGFVIMTGIALYQVLGMRSRIQARISHEVEQTLTEAVADWEDKLFVALAESIDTVVADPSLAPTRQNRLRRKWPWFSSLYLWRPARPGRRAEPAMLFPPRPVVEQPYELMGQPCLREANTFRDDVGIPASDRAQMLVEACAEAPLRVRLYAASEAAQLLEEEGDWAGALAALDAVDPSAELSLVHAAEQGVPAYRLAANRSHAADLMLNGPVPKDGLDLHNRLGLEICRLDAPSAAAPLQFVEHSALPKLREAGRDEQVARLEDALDAARRKVAAYREVVEKLLHAEPSPAPNSTPHFVRDQYSDDPYLLNYGWTEDGNRGVALQLEGRALVTSFLESRQLQRLRRYVVVRDTTGRWVAGSRRGGAVEVQVPFGQTFPEYRLGVRAAALTELQDQQGEQWRLPLVVTMFMAGLGIIGLLAQLRADRQREALLQRQRDFTTRVTHELKTPLAGIRVMAENLEIGAFKGDAQRSVMARRIMDETDRLTARLEEVLAIARERSIPDPEPFDPEESALGAIDQWGPRLEASGVQLIADMDATDEILGDGEAMRDAIGCLLDNALKYRREDREDPSVWLTLEQHGRWIEIAVADNGLGVPRHLRKSIFEQFVRVEGDNRGKAGGHGLGLSQVADVARAHRGKARCEVGVDGGARFVIRVPAHSA
jgi:signal transduction histidine kinase